MMSTLRDTEANLPPGFRFHPRDDELISDYLAVKVSAGGRYGTPAMVDVDLNKCEPWDLPEMARVGSKDWYFYSLRDRKYATGSRTNRATLSGYWKATGKDRQVTDARTRILVGMRKTLVFYQGRAPKGRKTDWVMHEFRLEGPSGESPLISSKEDWVLCRVFCKTRGSSSKSSIEENCYDDTGSSSLPPLLEQSPSFDQTPLDLEGFEQVPCFSNPAFNHTSQHLNPNFSQVESNIPSKNLAPFGSFPDLGTYLIPNNTSGYSFSCEKTVIKAVLDHFTKFEGNVKMEVPPNFEAGSFVRSLQSPISTESYFSETVLPSMWNNY